MQIASKEIKITSTTMGDMGKYVHNVEKEIEYYAIKLNQLYQRIEVSIFYNLSHT